MTVVVSYNRPLTREARRDLAEFGIVQETPVNELGRWTVVDLEEEPDPEILARHELRIERDPEIVYIGEGGERVEIYTDSVFVDGQSVAITPQAAREHAEAEGWEVAGA